MLPALKYLHQVKQVNEHVQDLDNNSYWFWKERPQALVKKQQRQKEPHQIIYALLLSYILLLSCSMHDEKCLQFEKTGNHKLNHSPTSYLPTECVCVTALDSVPCPVPPGVSSSTASSAAAGPVRITTLQDILSFACPTSD